MVAVYSDAALNDENRQLLNFIEVYEHDGPGWVFQNLFPYNCHYGTLIR